MSPWGWFVLGAPGRGGIGGILRRPVAFFAGYDWMGVWWRFLRRSVPGAMACRGRRDSNKDTRGRGAQAGILGFSFDLFPFFFVVFHALRGVALLPKRVMVDDWGRCAIRAHLDAVLGFGGVELSTREGREHRDEYSFCFDYD